MTKLTNYTPGPKGVHTEDQGLVYIGPGKTSDDLNISEGELKAARRTGWFTKPGDEAATSTDPAPPPPAAEFVPPVGPFRAGESSPGWWAIFDGKDQPVGKKVRKAELEGFDTFSEADKQTFATDHAKTAFDADNKA